MGTAPCFIVFPGKSPFLCNKTIKGWGHCII